jgi:hypothetical protein
MGLCWLQRSSCRRSRLISTSVRALSRKTTPGLKSARTACRISWRKEVRRISCETSLVFDPLCSRSSQRTAASFTVLQVLAGYDLSLTHT